MFCVEDEAIRRTRDTARKRKREEKRMIKGAGTPTRKSVPSPVVFVILSDVDMMGAASVEESPN